VKKALDARNQIPRPSIPITKLVKSYLSALLELPEYRHLPHHKSHIFLLYWSSNTENIYRVNFLYCKVDNAFFFERTAQDSACFIDIAEKKNKTMILEIIGRKRKKKKN
jgi:hypothetical protein